MIDHWGSVDKELMSQYIMKSIVSVLIFFLYGAKLDLRKDIKSFIYNFLR